MANLEKAIIIAAQAHQGQKDKAGYPYILHPLKMMLRMSSFTEMLVAVLHDIVEDTGWTLDALEKEGFPKEVLEAVDCLTRRDGESYEEFIERVKDNPIARRVKLADLEDNMDIRRISNLTESTKRCHHRGMTLRDIRRRGVPPCRHVPLTNPIRSYETPA